MQSFMYVIGPFLLQAGIGLGATIGALSWIFLRGIPGFRARKAELEAARAARANLERKTRAEVYAGDAQALLCDIMVRADAHLPHELVDRATTLATTPITDYSKQKELM